MPYQHLNVTLADVIYWCSVAHALGILASTLERWDDAACHFDAALEMHERMEAWPNLAQTKYEYARMLFARGDSADCARAARMLEQAQDATSEMGLLAISTKIRALFDTYPAFSNGSVAGQLAAEAPL